MSKSLIDMVNNEKTKERIIEIDGIKYYPVPLAAYTVGVSRSTMLHWCERKVVKSKVSGVPDIPLTVYVDIPSGHLYLHESGVEALMPKNRLVKLENSNNEDPRQMKLPF